MGSPVFLPAIIYPLTLIPFYILPTAEKLAIIKTIIADNRLIAAEPEGILPKGLGTLTRLAYGIILSVAQFSMLIKWKRKLKLSDGHYAHNRNTYLWLNYFTSMTSSLYVILFISVVFQLQIYFSIWQLLILFATCCNLFIIGYLLMKPSILYGMTGWLQRPNGVESVAEDKMTFLVQKTSDETPRNSLTSEQGLAYKSLLENHFQENKPFLKGGYTMGDLSRELSIPSHQLSAFINQEYSKNFNELINNYRVAYLENLVAVNPEYLHYTLEALGQLAGFKSRASFYAAVKKKTGLTPAALFGPKNTESAVVLS